MSSVTTPPGTIESQSIRLPQKKEYRTSESTLVVELFYGRTMPINLRAFASQGRGTPTNLDWVQTGDREYSALIPKGAGEVSVAWTSPFEGARVDARIEDAAFDPTQVHSPDIIEQFSQASLRNHGDDGIWLALDLCTSFAQLELATDGFKRAAHAIDIDERLFWASCGADAECLRAYLEARWLQRASLAKAGLDPERYLAPPVGLVETAIKCLNLVRAVVGKLCQPKHGSMTTFDVERFWKAALAFANGDLRRAGGGGLFNIEPNSLNVAAFAELADVVFRSKNVPTPALYDSAALRVIFASILEPYTDVYWDRAQLYPRQRHLYKPGTLDYLIHTAQKDPRWPQTAKNRLIRRYTRKTAKPAKADKIGTKPGHERWLNKQWGRTLYLALEHDEYVRRGY